MSENDVDWKAVRVALTERVRVKALALGLKALGAGKDAREVVGKAARALARLGAAPFRARSWRWGLAALAWGVGASLSLAGIAAGVLGVVGMGIWGVGWLAVGRAQPAAWELKAWLGGALALGLAVSAWQMRRSGVGWERAHEALIEGAKAAQDVAVSEFDPSHARDWIEESSRGWEALARAWGRSLRSGPLMFGALICSPWWGGFAMAWAGGLQAAPWASPWAWARKARLAARDLSREGLASPGYARMERDQLERQSARGKASKRGKGL